MKLVVTFPHTVEVYGLNKRHSIDMIKIQDCLHKFSTVAHIVCIF